MLHDFLIDIKNIKLCNNVIYINITIKPLFNLLPPCFQSQYPPHKTLPADIPIQQRKIRSTFFYSDITFFVSCRRNLWAEHSIQLLKSTFQLPPPPPPTDDRWGNLEKAGGAARYYGRLWEPRPCKEPPYWASSLTLCLAVLSSDKWISSDSNNKNENR